MLQVTTTVGSVVELNNIIHINPCKVKDNKDFYRKFNVFVLYKNIFKKETKIKYAIHYPNEVLLSMVDN